MHVAASRRSPGLHGIVEPRLARRSNSATDIGIHRDKGFSSVRMTNPHFATAESWTAAHAMLDFQPRESAETAGCQLQSLRIHIRDHRHRDLPIGG